MKRFLRCLSVLVILVAGFSLTVPEADARRLGGGKSFGRQSTAPAQRNAQPPRQATPQRPGTAPGQARGNRWLAPLAGLAAGLGLAALASHLGLGEEMGTLLLLLLLGVAAVAIFRRLAARGTGAPRPAWQGADAASAGGPAGDRAAGAYFAPDRPASGSASPAPDFRQAGGYAQAGEPVVPAGSTSIPAGFDVEGFTRNARVQFVRLQAVFDAGDRNDLRDFTTPEVYAELALQIDERAGAANRTDVLTLDVELLAIESTSEEHLASVRFSGMMREQTDQAAQPFDEIWTLTKPVDGPGGWLLAGIRQV